MKKIDKTSLKKKDKYRIRSWNDYNRSLVNRGSLTFRFDEACIQNWYSCKRTGNPGRPLTYADEAIRCGLVIKAVFRLPLTQTQGLIQSLIKILGVDLVCPHYSSFSRRAQDLDVSQRKLLKSGESLNIIFDQKVILGDRLSSREWTRQVTEMKIRNDILNKMLELGRAKSYKVVA